MVERPRGSGAPEEGTPEYDWLYGSGSDGASAADPTRPLPRTPGAASDATRRLPTMPRPSAQAARPPAAAGPTPGPGSPPPPAAPVRAAVRPTPPPMDPGPSRPGRTGRGFPVRRALLALLAAWLVFLVAVPWWAMSRIDRVDAVPSGDRPAEQDGTTYLLVGSDSRAGLSAAERRDLGTGAAGGQRTDTIMLLHVGAGPNLLMSIPRDSQVDVPGHGRTKINAAFAYGGPQLLVKTIEQNTGIRVDHYVEIGFGGFVGVVDAVGGIEICPTRPMKDRLANLDIPKGCQEADGATALGYARSRHTDPRYGDITRAQHQREVVSAVGRKAVSPWSVLNPVRYFRLNAAGSESVRVGEDTGPLALARFAWAMTRVSGKDGLTCTVPIQDLSVEWDTERAPQMFRHIIEDDTEGIGRDLCTPKGLPR